MRVQFSRRALRDLREIRAYISRENPVAGKRVVAQIRDACKGLPLNPLLGRARDEILPGHRSIRVGRYTVLYRVEPEVLQVTHVVHQSRDTQTALKQ